MFLENPSNLLHKAALEGTFGGHLEGSFTKSLWRVCWGVTQKFFMVVLQGHPLVGSYGHLRKGMLQWVERLMTTQKLLLTSPERAYL